MRDEFGKKNIPEISFRVRARASSLSIRAFHREKLRHSEKVPISVSANNENYWLHSINCFVRCDPVLLEIII